MGVFRHFPKQVSRSCSSSKKGVGANQHVHWFLGGKGLGIQQGTRVYGLVDQIKESAVVVSEVNKNEEIRDDDVV